MKEIDLAQVILDSYLRAKVEKADEVDTIQIMIGFCMAEIEITMNELIETIEELKTMLTVNGEN